MKRLVACAAAALTLTACGSRLDQAKDHYAWVKDNVPNVDERCRAARAVKVAAIAAQDQMATITATNDEAAECVDTLASSAD